MKPFDFCLQIQFVAIYVYTAIPIWACLVAPAV